MFSNQYLQEFWHSSGQYGNRFMIICYWSDRVPSGLEIVRKNPGLFLKILGNLPYYRPYKSLHVTKYDINFNTFYFPFNHIQMEEEKSLTTFLSTSPSQNAGGQTTGRRRHKSAAVRAVSETVNVSRRCHDDMLLSRQKVSSMCHLSHICQKQGSHRSG